ncbi:MAG: LacI family DNA-binding transcriptional regulator [Spirochaetes bacterium]|nr:LacI family DNA-binding transcriptional regulator [Spirochaetota bacterium]
MAVTLRDLARECGVSIYAVSRVLSGKPIYLVAEKRERILAAAKKRQFTPNAAARTLKTRKASTVGLVVNHITDSYILRIIEDLSLALCELDFALLLGNARDDLGREMAEIEAMGRRQCDALVVMSSFDVVKDRGRRAAYGKLLEQSGAVYFIDSPPPLPQARFAMSDNEGGAFRAVDQLLSRGKAPVYYLCGDKTYRVTAARQEGCRRAAEAHGVPWQRLRLDPEGVDSLPGALTQMEQGSILFYESLGNPLERQLSFLKKAGRRIPQDLRVCGFDAPVAGDALFFLKENAGVLTSPIPHMLQDRGQMVAAIVGALKRVIAGEAPPPLALAIPPIAVDF